MAIFNYFFGCKRDSLASFNSIVLKLGMYVHLDNSSDVFENGADKIQNGRRWAIFVFFYGCKRDSLASFNLIVLKLGMYVHLDNSSDELKIRSDSKWPSLAHSWGFSVVSAIHLRVFISLFRNLVCMFT